MASNQLLSEIKEKASILGYEKCGIINISAMKGYREKLAQRIERFPEIKPYTEEFFSFAELEKKFPWAKSVIICVRHYGKYHIPEHLHGMIAKYYLVDSRKDKNSNDYQASLAFEKFLTSKNIRNETRRDFGITSLRWAAQAAGLGIIRKNNFFYTEKGSWVYLEAWVIDQEFESIEEHSIPPCGSSCTLCLDSCPTHSLSEPYMMNRCSCVSCLTTWEGWDLPNDPYRKQIGGWVFGCDECQDACPYNFKKWESTSFFPHLDEISSAISLEKIIEMDYEYLRTVMAPKFWYIPEDKVWRWKTNALNGILNNYQTKFSASIELALQDEHPEVRRMAQFVKQQLS